METLTASHAPQQRRNVAATRKTSESGREPWPIPLPSNAHPPSSEPMARGAWPAFCAEATRLYDLDNKGRNGRNGRVAKKLKVATTTIRRAVGSFPAIIAFANGNKVIARSLADIPFASAVILANWAKRDRKTALEMLDECCRGLGTSTLSAREVASRRPKTTARWKPLGPKEVAAEAAAHPGAPSWIFRSRALLRDLAKCKAADREKVIAAHGKVAGRSPSSARIKGAALQELIRLSADRPEIRIAIGLTAGEESAPQIMIDPAHAARVGAMARRTFARLADQSAPARPAESAPARGGPRRGKVLMSRRRNAIAAWPLKGAMPKGARDWLSSGHWHLIAQDAYKSGMAPTRFAQKKGMLAGTLGIAVRTLVDASELANGDPVKAEALSHLSTAAVHAVRLLSNRDKAKADALVRNIGKLGGSSVLIKALALDDGVTSKDVAAIARQGRKARA